MSLEKDRSQCQQYQRCSDQKKSCKAAERLLPLVAEMRVQPLSLGETFLHRVAASSLVYSLFNVLPRALNPYSLGSQVSLSDSGHVP